MNDYATAEDFKRWAAKARAATWDSLQYVVKDCREAAEAMRGHNPVREGRYLDEMHTYIEEMNRRAGK